MGIEYSKTLGLEEVGGANFHGLIFLWVREDEIFVNFKLVTIKICPSMNEYKTLSKPRRDIY